MPFHWPYDLSLWSLGTLTAIVFVTISVAGGAFGAPWVARIVASDRVSEHNDIVNNFLSGIGLFYGLMIGLISIAAWEELTSVEDLISHEAATIAMLYRDFQGYPPELRDQFRESIRRYTKYVIEQEWPAQQRGETMKQSSEQIEDCFNTLFAFEPKTEAQKATHEETIDVLNRLVDCRRQRLIKVDASIPGALWAVVLIGALLTIGLTFLFRIENLRLQIVLNTCLGLIVGLLVFIVVAIDHPFWGQFSVSVDPFVVTLENVLRS